MTTYTCAGCGGHSLETTIIDNVLHGLCRDCFRLQEIETRADPIRQLCDNCACRPNSPERTDSYGWMRWEEKHIEGGVPFYCHKGLAQELDPRGTMHVHATPQNIAEAKAKPCAGWLSKRLAYLSAQVRQ